MGGTQHPEMDFLHPPETRDRRNAFYFPYGYWDKVARDQVKGIEKQFPDSMNDRSYE